jgi:hypothetical protein
MSVDSPAEDTDGGDKEDIKRDSKEGEDECDVLV